MNEENNNNVVNENNMESNNTQNQNTTTDINQNNENTQVINQQPVKNEFSNVIDPSTITASPSEVNTEIKVDNTENNNKEQIKKEEQKKSNAFGLFLVFLLFVGVGVYIWFMPEINDMLNKNKETSTNSEEQKEKTTEESASYDTLVCSKISSSYVLYHQDSKLKKYTIKTTYTTDIENKYQSCLTLRQSEKVGFSVNCEKEANSYDLEKLDSAFQTEFLKDAEISTIKTTLENNGYTCN